MGFVVKKKSRKDFLKAQVEAPTQPPWWKPRPTEILDEFKDFCNKLGGKFEEHGYHVGTTYYSCVLPAPTTLKLRVMQHPRETTKRELKPGRVELELSQPKKQAWFHEYLSSVKIVYNDMEVNVTHDITASSTHNTASGFISRIKEIVLGIHPSRPEHIEIGFKTVH